MSASQHSIAAGVSLDREYMPALRYAFGIMLIMGYAMAFGGSLSYIVPYLALNFLAPGSKKPSLRQGITFVAIVALTSFAGLVFTFFFYDFIWVYIPLLGLILFYLYYTDSLQFIVKLFLLIALLAFPVPMPGIDPSTWAFAIANTLVIGSFFTIIMVWIVYTLFPDKPLLSLDNETPAAAAKKLPGKKERFNNALETFIITFPVVLVFIFFQWESALLVLLYIVVLSMMQEASHTAGKVKIFGNLIGGLATIIFYVLIIIVPSFFFFLLLLPGTALLFADRIFSERPDASLYKTGFSALVLIIGSVSTGTEAAGSEIWLRILQVMTAVLYVVAALAVVEAFKARKRKRAERKQHKNVLAEV